MKIRKELEKFFYRVSKSKKKFFKDVYINDKDLARDILDWVFSLKCNKVINFAYFFSKCNIVFPIQVEGLRHLLKIRDNAGNEYYFNYTNKEGTYTIGKIGKKLTKEFKYQLTQDSKIILKRMSILSVDADENATIDSHCEIKIESTKITIKQKSVTLEFLYDIQNEEFNDKISEYIYELINNDKYVNDVVFTCEHIANMLKQEKIDYSVDIKTGNEDKTFWISLCEMNGIM